MVTLAVAAVTVLSSCAQAGSAPGSTASPAVSAASPSPSSPVASPTPAVASDTPAPLLSPQATGSPGTDRRIAVVPFITTADWDASAGALNVSAIVPGVVESGGTCTVTLTSGSTVRTATSGGVGASSYTGCAAVAVQGLAAGTWQVRVRYTSAKSAGTSAVRTVQVP